MTFGYSCDDAGTFLPHYIDRKILADDPFQVLNQEGVGQLVRLGTERGRSLKPELKVGICGEHGGAGPAPRRENGRKRSDVGPME